MLKLKFRIDDFLMFLSILFIGTDVWALNLGINIRFIQIFYLIVFAYFVFKYNMSIFHSKALLLFLGATFLSTLFAISISQSLPYYIWIIYNFIIVIPIFYTYLLNRGFDKLFSLFKVVVRTILILVLIQLFLDMILDIQLPFLVSQHYLIFVRPALWFYEPSYLASYMTIFVALFSYLVIVRKEFKYLFDLLISMAVIIATTSTTGFLAIFFSVFFCFCLKIIMIKDIKQKIKIFVSCISILIIGVLFLKLFFTDIFDRFIMRIFTEGISGASGDRVLQYSSQVEAFLKSPIFGIGLDCYGVYMGDVNIVPSNVTLELLATSGIIGCVAFYFIPFSMGYEVFFSKNYSKYKYSKPLIFSLFIFLIILQANQNYLRLYMWMLFGFCYAAIKLERKLQYKNINEDDSNEQTSLN